MRRRRVVPHPLRPSPIPPPVVVISVNQRSSPRLSEWVVVCPTLWLLWFESLVWGGGGGGCLLCWVAWFRSTSAWPLIAPAVTTVPHAHTHHTPHTYTPTHTHDRPSTSTTITHTRTASYRPALPAHRLPTRCGDDDGSALPHRAAAAAAVAAAIAVALCTAVGWRCPVHCSCACWRGVAADGLAGQVCGARAGERTSGAERRARTAPSRIQHADASHGAARHCTALLATATYLLTTITRAAATLCDDWLR